MENDAEGNGHRHSGDLPDRMRRLFSRGAAASPGPPAGTLDQEGLRGDIHAAVDRVMDGTPASVPPNQLKHDLQAAVGRAVDDHIATAHHAAPAPTSLAGRSQAATQSVDRVMDRLDGVVRRTLDNARPGMERSRAYLAAQLPRLIDRLTVVLMEIAADEQRMQQVEAGLIRLLKTRLSEKTARRVARLAVSAARAAAWRKRRGSSGKG
jgi:hypothetical protein